MATSRGVAGGTAAGRGVSRRRLLQGSAAAAGAALTGFPMIARAASVLTLRWQGAWSARDICHEYALDFASTVREMSGGRLRIQVLPAGAVVKPEELIDAVNKGVIDGCHAVPDLWHRRNPAFSLFGAGPPLGLDAVGLLGWMEHGGGRAFYEQLYERVMSYRLIGFLYGPRPSQPLGWFRSAPAARDALRGLKLAADGLAGQMFREMGAEVVTLPDAEIAPALARGEVEGVAGRSTTSDHSRGLTGAARVCLSPSLHRTGEVFEVLINRGRFEALPAELRALFPLAARAAGAELAWKAIDRYSEDFERLREAHGIRFERAPEALLRAQLAAWRAVVARTIEDNPFFESVFRSQRAWARRTVAWAQAMTPDPRMAYDYWFADDADPAAGHRR